MWPSANSQREFAGCLKGLRIFDVSSPGWECRTLSTHGAHSSGEGGVVWIVRGFGLRVVFGSGLVW